jgi:LacI family transcriptional regulator
LKKNNPTLSDVALKAGVSMMTVSRVINNKGKVKPQTREQVLKIAAEIGYRPNYIARSLATKRSTTIGLVVPDITNPFFSEIAKGIEDEAYRLGYNVFLCNFEENPEREIEALTSLAEKQVDGIVLCSSRQNNKQLYHSLRLFKQVVLINRQLPKPANNTQSLVLDDFNGAKLAVEHLLRHERKRIVLLSGPKRSHSAVQKQQGFLAALKKHNLPYDPEQIKHCLPTMMCGKDTMSMLLKNDPAIDAVLAFNDLLAIGAMLACQEFGKTIPQELEIIGFDDIPLSKLITPGITTLTYPKKEIGAIAMQIIYQMMNQDKSLDFPKTFAPQFVFRQSSPK